MAVVSNRNSVNDEITRLGEIAHAEAAASLHIPLWAWLAVFAPVTIYLVVVLA